MHPRWRIYFGTSATSICGKYWFMPNPCRYELMYFIRSIRRKIIIKTNRWIIEFCTSPSIRYITHIIKFAAFKSLELSNGLQFILKTRDKTFMPRWNCRYSEYSGVGYGTGIYVVDNNNILGHRFIYFDKAIYAFDLDEDF